MNARAGTHIGAQEFGLVCMLPVELRFKQIKLNLAYSILNGNAPCYLSPTFNLTRNTHTINKRPSAMSLRVLAVYVFGKTAFTRNLVKMLYSIILIAKRLIYSNVINFSYLHTFVYYFSASECFFMYFSTFLFKIIYLCYVISFYISQIRNRLGS